MDIKFCGAAGHVTGSAHLITLKNGYKIGCQKVEKQNLSDCWWGVMRDYHLSSLDGNDGTKVFPKKIDTLYRNAKLICDEFA